MNRQPIKTVLATVFGLAILMFGGTALAGPVDIPFTFSPNTKAKAAEVNQNFSVLEGGVDGNAADIGANLIQIENNANNFSALDQRLNRVEVGTLQTVSVRCDLDQDALKNMTLTPNTEYELTGICAGQVIVDGGSLGTIVIKGDGAGTKNDGITLFGGATSSDTFAAVYGNNGVHLILENLVITASDYNSSSDLFIGAIGSYQGAQVIIRDVDVIGGDYGIGVYNTAFASIDGNSSVTGFSLNGLRSERASVIRVFDTLSVAGDGNSDHFGSEGLAAYSGGVIVIDDDGDENTSHSITAASGPNINISPNDNVAAVSAWQNGVIRMWDADIDGVVWSGDSSVVDLRDVYQENGYVNPYRNSVLRFRGSDILNGAAADMSIYAGDFSVFRTDDTFVRNISGSEIASAYRFGVIDLRAGTDFGNRDINCFDVREYVIRAGASNVGNISCQP